MEENKLAKQILYTKFKKGFFSDLEEIYALEALEEYKERSIKILESIINIKEKKERNGLTYVLKTGKD